jgi:TIR domain
MVPHQYRRCRYCNEWFYIDENGPELCSYHPKMVKHLGTTGARDDYVDIYSFACCNEQRITEYIEGRDVPPSQAPGCHVGRHVVEVGWKLFLSYAREDERIAGLMENELRRRGHKVWRDRAQIQAGGSWQHAIDKAIAANDLMVVLVSAASTSSREVRREIDVAVSGGKYVLPILLEDVDIPEPLRAINGIDWRSVDLTYGFFAGDGSDEVRHGVVFGAPDGYWQRIEEAMPDTAIVRTEKQPIPDQIVVLLDASGDQLGVVRPRQRLDWRPGHLVTQDGLVFVVVDVIKHSPTAVEVKVERALAPVQERRK